MTPSVRSPTHNTPCSTLPFMMSSTNRSEVGALGSASAPVSTDRSFGEPAGSRSMGSRSGLVRFASRSHSPPAILAPKRLISPRTKQRVARRRCRHHLCSSGRRYPVFSPSWRSLLGAWEVSTCSARSAARTNDVDTDKRRETINDGGKRESLQSVEDGQGSTPAGELASDRGVGDHGRLAAGVQASPPGMQAPVRPLPAIARGRSGAAGPPPCGRACGDARPLRSAADGRERFRSW
jgi:hypothetical protein